MNKSINGFDHLIAQLSSKEERVSNDAFEAIRSQISDAKHQVHCVAEREQHPRVLSLLIELLGESKDDTYYPFISEQMASDDARIRFFAHAALLRLGTPRARDLYFSCSLREIVRAPFNGNLPDDRPVTASAKSP